MTEASKAGLIGPTAGRWYSLLAKTGSTGDKTKDRLIGRIKSGLLLMKMHVDAGIGGTRAAASPLLLKSWEDLAMSSSPDLIGGYLSGIREDLGGEASTTTKDSGPKRVYYDASGKPKD